MIMTLYNYRDRKITPTVIKEGTYRQTRETYGVIVFIWKEGQEIFICNLLLIYLGTRW